VTIDGTAQKASSLLGYAGAYSVTLSTTLPTLALELHSTYLGHSQTATIAAHLLLRPDARNVRTVKHAAGALPVAGAQAARPGARGRAGLPLDHLSELHLQRPRCCARTSPIRCSDARQVGRGPGSSFGARDRPPATTANASPPMREIDHRSAVRRAR
jgi:hypothetical protein